METLKIKLINMGDKTDNVKKEKADTPADESKKTDWSSYAALGLIPDPVTEAFMFKVRGKGSLEKLRGQRDELEKEEDSKMDEAKHSSTEDNRKAEDSEQVEKREVREGETVSKGTKAGSKS